MRYIIADLEATCWEEPQDRSRMEIIEIGAVLMRTEHGPSVSEFASFVRPILEPELSEFCQTLTSIRQEDVDQADMFSLVFPHFLDWIGPEPFTLCTWGDFDVKQFRRDCSRHRLAFPTSFEQYINLKQEFARQRNIRPCGMKRALKITKIPLEGQHHRGIDDARNIAKLAQMILPNMRHKSDES